MKTRTVNLNASDNRLGGKYQAGTTVLVLCDATDDALSVYLPDSKNTIDVHFIFQKTDSSSNAVTIYSINGQTINGSASETLTAQYDSAGLFSDNTNWIKTEGIGAGPLGITVADSSSIDLTLAGTQISGMVLPAGVDHNSLLNCSADEHVGHSGIDITAGAGLTGGGDISADRTLAVGAGLGITVNEDDVQIKNADSLTDDTLTKWDDANGQLTDSIISDDGTDATIDGGLTTEAGRKLSITVITAGDSPYTPQITDHVIDGDTASGAIVVNLPAGIDRTWYRIRNCGSAGNNVTINPNGAELLMGENTAYILLNGEYIDIGYSG